MLSRFEKSTTGPAVAHRYLMDVPLHLARLGITPSPATIRALQRRLRNRWHFGRCQPILRHIAQSLAKQDISHRGIADALAVSGTAVGGWLNGVKGIEPQNLELLIRHCGLSGIRSSFSKHSLDLAGYSEAISWLRSIRSPSEITHTEFWAMWFALRNNAWADSDVHEKQAKNELADELWKCANRQLLESLDAATHRARRDDYSTWLARCEDRWASAFIVAVEHLDHVCWTGPDDPDQPDVNKPLVVTR